MAVLAPYNEAVDAVRDAGGEALKLCYQCGICTATCPWNRVRSFMVRKIIHQAQLGLVDLEGEDMWACTGCRACTLRCPRGVEMVDIMRALRRIIIEVGAGKAPDSLRLVAKNLAGIGLSLIHI